MTRKKVHPKKLVKVYNRSELVSQEIDDASGNKYEFETSRSKLQVIKNMRQRTAVRIKQNNLLPTFTRLMPIVCSKEVLLTAYGNIKSNKESTTPGTQNQTADEMSMERIEKLSLELKNGTYNFPDVRRTWIPKPIKEVDWKKKENLIKLGRPLGVPDFDAKLVQEATRMVLSAIYEPIFDYEDVSFGFRPKLGCQNALTTAQTKAQGMVYAMEGDIKGAYGALIHERLIFLLSQRIQDRSFLDLILKMCKAGIFDALQNIRTDSLIGVPQGAIVSPLLWNIYMHEFDKYINNDIKSFVEETNQKQQRHTSVASPLYRSLLYKKENRLKKRQAFYELSKLPNLRLKNPKYDSRNNRGPIQPAVRAWRASVPPETCRKWVSNISKMYGYVAKAYLRKVQRMPSKQHSAMPIRICYIRYADDWILFCNGTSAFMDELKNKIATFLKDELGLTLSAEKTKITKLVKEPARFLGYEIKMYRTRKIQADKDRVQRRIGGNRPIMGVDKVRLKERMEWRGYVKKGKPCEQPAWSTLTDYEIVMKYNSVIRGLVLYYAPIINYKSTLNYYVYLLEYSCYKTLCQKHRTTIRKLMKKYGKSLVVKKPNSKKSGEIKLLTVRTYEEVLNPIIKNMISNLRQKNPDQSLLASSDFLNNAKTYWRTAFKFSGRCVICGCKENVEMHHIRHIRGSKKDEPFRRIMGLLNRKQIPVCQFHHKLIHDGKYDNISLSELYDTRIATVENFLQLG